MLKRSSVLVKTWVSLVAAGTYKREDVPDIFNLRKIVYRILDEKEAER